MKPKVAVSGIHGLVGSKLGEVLRADGIPRELLYDPVSLTQFLKGYDTVIHCASYGNHHWQTDLSQIFISNVFATENLLEACRINQVSNFIFMGSSSEYGDKNCPMVEEMIPECYTMYGCCKVAGEYLTRHYSAYMNTVTVRPFSIYGEKEDPGMFIPTLIRCIKTGELFMMYDGNHDWVYVDDFAKAILIILKNMPIVNGLTINVGTGINITNREIIETMMLISGSELTVKPMGGGNPLWVANSDKIRTLGWKPKISLYEGLKRVYNAL